MRIKIIILLLLLPLGLFSQTKTLSNLEGVENGWLTLANDWYYQKGDNIEWANPEFNDSTWKKFSSTNLNMPGSTTIIANDNDIVWFRKYIKVDSLLIDDFVLDVDQQGASEIYLDGKLIHKLGTVSTNPDILETHNPIGAFLPFPLVQGKAHVLAVRYVNGQYKYPENQRYTNTNGFIRLKTTALSNANKEMVLTITDSTFTDRRQQLRSYWRYQKGDDKAWAKAEFDDSAWGQFTNYNLNMPDGKAIANDNEIAWFRKRIKADSTLTETIAIEVYQQGASEIYLDGKLIHELGTVSSNPENSVNQNPSGNFLSLPLVQGKEHVLAVRYVNSQYKYPKNRRFANTNGLIGIWIGSLNYSNAQRTLTIADATVADQWQTIYRYWRYQKGDDPNWAQPDFDDSSWAQMYSTNLNMPDNEAIAGNNEIAWFRKPIKADSTLNHAVVFRVYQTGASEIYLDGKLIHTLGKVSSNPDEAEMYYSHNTILSLPLIKNKEHVLAVRFMNFQAKYPLYDERESIIRMQTTTLNNLLTNGPELSFVEDNARQINKNNNYIVLGIGLFMFILFLSYYVFFPTEKINAYFALASLFFSLFMATVIWDLQITRVDFTVQLLTLITSVVYTLLVLFCVYKIFNRKLGVFFWSVVIINILGISIAFLFDPTLLAPIVAMFLVFDIIRISIKSYKTHKTGALIFITASILTMLYWIISLTFFFFRIESLAFLGYYQAIAFSFLPIGIAIYLGFAFGKRSQSLRLNLERVKKLSKEKQHILSKQNETLEQQVKERTASLNQSLENLKATQGQLIQSEKMASLGELTAGIAHEIQNPLNFVNNFSDVSNELIDEIQEEREKNKEERDEELVGDILEDIKQNLEKITHHGKRADGIVKGMLQHSRISSGKKEPTDINKLIDEYFRLAYHGLRAKDKSFNASLETHYDKSLEKIAVIPQDIGRVILNLFTNAFYAVEERKSSSESKDYKPTVSVSTEKVKDKVTILVRDNGNGIPKTALDKIFQPFFTTKPTGKGTGLGLSMSYDIIKAHNGNISVDTKANIGTEFKITLPITQ